MSARALSAVEPAKGWQPWGALVLFLGIAFVASTVISLTAVLQYAGLVDAKENPIGLIGFISFLLFPFAALGVVVLGWVCLVERRPLAAIGLGGAHRTHRIHNARRLAFVQDQAGAQLGFDVHSDDDTTTTVRFRVPVRSRRRGGTETPR